MRCGGRKPWGAAGALRSATAAAAALPQSSPQADTLTPPMKGLRARRHENIQAAPGARELRRRLQRWAFSFLRRCGLDCPAPRAAKSKDAHRNAACSLSSCHARCGLSRRRGGSQLAASKPNADRTRGGQCRAAAGQGCAPGRYAVGREPWAVQLTHFIRIKPGLGWVAWESGREAGGHRVLFPSAALGRLTPNPASRTPLRWLPLLRRSLP
jgi:hypothetical protein